MSVPRLNSPLAGHPRNLADLIKGVEHMHKLDERIALITGGNSGISLATAKQFVNEGAHVFITGRRDPELAVAVKEREGQARYRIRQCRYGEVCRAPTGASRGPVDRVTGLSFVVR
jgi:NAD(P)-dependent dehydrogenase (short-subunit alcohol dehydrogenase family)